MVRHQGTKGRLECLLLTQFSFREKKSEFPLNTSGLNIDSLEDGCGEGKKEEERNRIACNQKRRFDLIHAYEIFGNVNLLETEWE